MIDSQTFENEIKEWQCHSTKMEIVDEKFLNFDKIVPNHNVYIVGGMGTGKTEGLKIFINKCIENGDNNLSILWITSRRSISAKSHGDFKDLNFEIYWDTTGALYARRLVVQVESLSRIDVNRVNYDIVVIDEAVLMIEQFDCSNSANLRNIKILSLQMLLVLLKRAKYSIFMDAFASTNMFSVFQSMNDIPSQLIVNVYQKTSDRRIEIIEDFEIGLKMLLDEIRGLPADCKIFIACEEKNFAKILHTLITETYKNIKTRLITGDTDDLAKMVLFNNINDKLTENIVIYTNVISVGISYVLPVKTIYGFFTGRILHPRNIIQMLGRARCCTEWRIIFNKKLKNEDPSSVKEINRQAYMSLISRPIFIQLRGCGLEITPQDFREAYFAIILFCQSLKLEAKHEMKATLINLLMRYGAESINEIKESPIDDGISWASVIRNIKNKKKTELAESRCEVLKEKHDIEDLLRISEREGNLTENEKMFIESTKLLDFYQFEGKVTPHLFEYFHGINVQKLWFRVTFAINHPNFNVKDSKQEGMELVKFIEALSYRDVIANQVFLMHGNLFYAQNSAARYICEEFGFRSLWAKEGIATADVSEILTSKRMYLQQYMRTISPRKYDKASLIKELWRDLNNSIYKILGVKMSKKNKNIELIWPKNFNYVLFGKMPEHMYNKLNKIEIKQIKESIVPIIYVNNSN